MNEQYERAKQILAEYTEKHNQLAELLLRSEVIYSEDVAHIFGKRQWVSRSDEIMKLQNGNKKPGKEMELFFDTPK